MNKILTLLSILIGIGMFFIMNNSYPIQELETDKQNIISVINPNGWKRPDGPPTVALQVGHWKNDDLPEELDGLTGNTGSSGGGKSEWEVNLEIAEQIKLLLSEYGIQVEILSTVVPPAFWADAFIAIHADGNLNTEVSGYKVAASRRDRTNSAQTLSTFVDTEYEKSTKLPRDLNITRNMTGYYAFNSRRYEHAIHPMTPGIIIETGFLTNPSDREIIIDNSELAAQGISNGIIKYLEYRNLL